MKPSSIARKLRYLVGVALPPRRLKHVEIETTSYCNRKCLYCPNHSVGRPEEPMKEEIFFRIIDSLARMGFRGRISPHFYGEPLADPRLPRFMKYAHEKLPSSELIVYTNGDFLSLEKFLELKAAGVKQFRVSLHSKLPTKALAQTLEHVAQSPEASRDVETVNYYEEFNSRNILHLNNRGGLVKIQREKNPVCPYVNQLTINYLGDAVLCCNDYKGTVTFGNVMKMEIGDIWRGRAYAEARARISNGMFPYEICRSCNV